MTDLPAAIAAAREALAAYRRNSTRHYIDEALEDVLAALDAAQGEVVAGHVQCGSVAIPFWVIDYAQKIELFMKVNGVDAWALGGIQSRDLPPPQAPPAAVPANVRERWNIERDGDALRVCFNDHEKGEDCEYVRYVPEAPPAAVHSTQDCYEHFLAYSGATDHPWLKYAYFHGADVGIEKPNQAPPAADYVGDAGPATDDDFVDLPTAVPAGYVPVSALIEAREEVESWAAYATPYFQDKHDLAEVLAKIDGQIAAAQAQQPAAAVPAANVTPMRQPRLDLARLVDAISAAVYANGDGLSVTEAIGALELAKLELLKEQEQ